MATPEEKFELITRRLQEVLGGDAIKAILDKGESPVAYWGAYSAKHLCVKHLLITIHFVGTAPTGRREMHFPATENIHPELIRQHTSGILSLLRRSRIFFGQGLRWVLRPDLYPRFTVSHLIYEISPINQGSPILLDENSIGRQASISVTQNIVPCTPCLFPCSRCPCIP
jgi:hypothetical protein